MSAGPRPWHTSMRFSTWNTIARPARRAAPGGWPRRQPVGYGLLLDAQAALILALANVWSGF